jgi:protein-disulfide isomerase
VRQLSEPSRSTTTVDVGWTIVRTYRLPGGSWSVQKGSPVLECLLRLLRPVVSGPDIAPSGSSASAFFSPARSSHPPPRRLPLLPVLLGVWAIWSVGLSQPAAAATPELRQEMEEVIRQYLHDHPEVVVDALQAMEERERHAQRERASEAIRAHADELFNAPEDPVGGTPRGTTTIVEFFDYQCPHCQRVHGPLKMLLATDPDVRLVYKEFPILGPGSTIAAQAALAGRAQGRYAALHDALMEAAGPLDEPAVLRIAASVGLDVERLKQDMRGPAIAAILERNARLARLLGINGSPTFIAGTKLVPGEMSLEELKAFVRGARPTAGGNP